MGHIFLSYSRKDSKLMRRIRNDLVAEGLEVWTDESLITGSQSWKQQVERALEDAPALVVILTPNAKSSDWVREEMDYAEAHEVRIFPILAAGTTKSSVPFGFITAQWVDIRREASYTAQMQELVFTLRVHLGFENLAQEKPSREHTNEETILAPPHDTSDDTQPPQPKFPSNISKAIMVLQNRESKWWRRVDALGHLGNLRHEKVLPVLRAYLDDDDLDVRQAAQNAIDYIVKPLDLDEEAGATDLEDTILTVNVSKEMPSTDELIDHDDDADSEIPPLDTSTERLKLVITGPSHKQRRAFINAVSDTKPVTISREISPSDTQRITESTKVAMTYGRIQVTDNHMLYLFGMPSNQQFDFMWKVLAEGMLGFVFLVDATRPDTFEDARITFETFRSHASTVPYIIGVDNFKTPNAWRLEDIRSVLRLSETDTILPYMSVGKVSVQNILLQLTYLIMDGFES